MSDELIRTTIGFDITTDDINVLANIIVPRNARGTLVFAQAQLGYPVAAAGAFAGWWSILALVSGVRTEASLTNLISLTNISSFFQSLHPIVADQITITEEGTPTGEFLDLTMKFERDFESLSDLRKRALGLAILNKGPASNQQQGWSLVTTAFDETLELAGFLIVELLLEWPKNITMQWKEQHIANEENQ